jgi:hypothetical protein
MRRYGPVDHDPDRRQLPRLGQALEHRPAAPDLGLALDRERRRSLDAQLGLQSFHRQPQAAEPPPKTALEIEKAKVQPCGRTRVDGGPLSYQSTSTA